jgi:hypothetical protein
MATKPDLNDVSVLMQRLLSPVRTVVSVLNSASRLNRVISENRYDLKHGLTGDDRSEPWCEGMGDGDEKLEARNSKLETMNTDKVIRSRQRNIATPKDTACHNAVERVAAGSVRTAHASVVVALPPVQERTRVLREPFSFRAPEVVFEWLITARWLDLFPYQPAERDLISVCCNLPDSHGAAVLLGEPTCFPRLFCGWFSAI